MVQNHNFWLFISIGKNKQWFGGGDEINGKIQFQTNLMRSS